MNNLQINTTFNRLSVIKGCEQFRDVKFILQRLSQIFILMRISYGVNSLAYFDGSLRHRLGIFIDLMCTIIDQHLLENSGFGRKTGDF